MLLQLLPALIVAWTVWSLVSLYQNYAVARTIKLPIVIEPVSWLNLPWILFNQILKSQPVLSKFRNDFIRRYLPFSYIGWQFDQGHKIHARLGPAFVLVSSASIQVMVGDATAAHDLLSRRKDFIKPSILYERLNVFGPNLNTAEGEVWQRHRRIAAPSLNEKVSASVWKESLAQAEQALEFWISRGEHGVTSITQDAATLALNVLSACGFGESTAFKSTPTDKSAASTISYRDAVMIILKQFPILLAVPMRYLDLPFMPKASKQLSIACRDFKRHVASILEKQRTDDSPPDSGKGSLLTNLVRASDMEKSDKTGQGLTDEEMLGNMFIFTLAGHETTANTIATAVTYLTRYPKYQQWVREELQLTLADASTNIEDYELMFPRLKRCLAVMYETLRIHGSIVFIPKATSQEAQQLKIRNEIHTVPANTFVTVNNHAIQQDPAIWGDDADKWLPQRWILDKEEAGVSSALTNHDKDGFLQPAPGAFIPWADGPRICPGKKFAQVEFVAFMAAVFSQHKVEPATSYGEHSAVEVNKRLDLMLQDAEISTATLQMRKPELVALRWNKCD